MKKGKRLALLLVAVLTLVGTFGVTAFAAIAEVTASGDTLTLYQNDNDNSPTYTYTIVAEDMVYNGGEYNASSSVSVNENKSGDFSPVSGDVTVVGIKYYKKDAPAQAIDAPKSVGSYVVTKTYKVDGSEYSISDSFSITARKIEFNWKVEADKTYDKKSYIPDAELLPKELGRRYGDLGSGDTFTVTLADKDEGISAGKHTANIVIKDADGKDVTDNYNILNGTRSKEYTIKQKPVDIKWNENDKEMPYTGEALLPRAKAEVLETGDVVTVQTSVADGVDNINPTEEGKWLKATAALGGADADNYTISGNKEFNFRVIGSYWPAELDVNDFVYGEGIFNKEEMGDPESNSDVHFYWNCNKTTNNRIVYVKESEEDEDAYKKIALAKLIDLDAEKYDVKMVIPAKDGFTETTVYDSFEVYKKGLIVKWDKAQAKLVYNGEEQGPSASAYLPDESAEGNLGEPVEVDIIIGNKQIDADKYDGEDSAYIAGIDDDNYSIKFKDEPLAFEITKRPVRVEGLVAEDKEFDNRVLATFDTEDASIVHADGFDVGRVGDDDVYASKATGYFASKHVGKNLDVTVLSVELDGDDAYNYEVAIGAKGWKRYTKGNITSRTIYVNGYKAGEKEYDGTVNATDILIDSEVYISDYDLLQSLGQGVSVKATGEFNNPNVGTNKPITITLKFVGDSYFYKTNEDIVFDRNTLTTSGNIVPKEVTLKWFKDDEATTPAVDPIKYIYNKNEQGPVAKAYESDESEEPLEYEVVLRDGKKTDAGTYKATAASLSGTKNYVLPEGTANITKSYTIDKFPLRITWYNEDDQPIAADTTDEYTYDGDEHSPYAVALGVDDNDEFDVTVKTGKTEDTLAYGGQFDVYYDSTAEEGNRVKPYTAKVVEIEDVPWRIEFFGNEKNYTLEGSNVTQLFQINQREVKLSWAEASYIYDGAPHTPVATVTNLATDLRTGDKDVCNVDVKVEAKDGSSLTPEGKAVEEGKYTAKAESVDNTNYKLPGLAQVFDFAITKSSGGGGGGTVTDEVQKVVDMLKALDPNAADYAAKAQEAIDAYNKLTPEQQADKRFEEQTVATKLADAQAAVATAADKKAAADASAVIVSLPADPSQATEAEAQAAWAAYNSLTDAQKALLSDEAKQRVAAYKYYYEVQYAKAQKAKMSYAKAKKGKKAVAKWKKVSDVDGYQLYYKAKGTKAKKVTISKASTVKKTVKKLKAGKKYSFKVRTYTKVYNPAEGVYERVYGQWSKVKKAKAKK